MTIKNIILFTLYAGIIQYLIIAVWFERSISESTSPANGKCFFGKYLAH